MPLETRTARGVANAPGAAEAVRAVTADVLASRRYRSLAPEFVERVVRGVMGHTRRPADAVKETKRRLHQACGAYVQTLDPERVIESLEAAAAGGPEALRHEAQRIMESHASTRERLSVLDRYYAEIFERTGPPSSVLDLACGFAPLALPWMRLPLGARYDVCDVDARFVAIARACLRVFGVDGRAELRDVLGAPPAKHADVALLLKAVPVLEQQRAGSAGTLLDALDARYVVVSYPTRSLGGAGKGMVSHYRSAMDRLMSGRPWTMSELLFPLELVFVIEKHGG